MNFGSKGNLQETTATPPLEFGGLFSQFLECVFSKRTSILSRGAGNKFYGLLHNCWDFGAIGEREIESERESNVLLRRHTALNGASQTSSLKEGARVRRTRVRRTALDRAPRKGPANSPRAPHKGPANTPSLNKYAQGAKSRQGCANQISARKFGFARELGVQLRGAGGRGSKPTQSEHKGGIYRNILEILRTRDGSARFRLSLLSGPLLTSIPGCRLLWPVPLAALSIRSWIAPILAGPRSSRAEVVGPALFVNNAEPTVAIGLKDDRGDFRGIHSTAGHMGQELASFFGEAIHHLGVVSQTRFEVVGGKAELAPKSSKFAPGARQLACDAYSETARHHVGRKKAWRVSIVSRLTKPLVIPRALARGLIDAPRGISRAP